MSSEKSKIISGILFPGDAHDIFCQLYLFKHAPEYQKDPVTRKGLYSGQGRFEHAKLISRMLYRRAFEWHSWSELIVEKACSEDWLAICGCGASSKSTSVGLYALIWWMASPLDSAVIIASKTIDSAKKRIWREVARFYSLFSNAVGGYKDAVIGSSPRPYICPLVGTDRKKDEAHGLYVTALHGKETEKEVGYIKGFHPRRVLAVADELDVLEDGGKALVDTFTDNLSTGTYEAQIIVLGNDPSLFNSLGDLMAPEYGKPISLANTEWKSFKGYSCLRLDAWDSPNIKDRDKWTGLVRQKDIDRITKNGEELNSPSVWIQLHGLHPPEGSSNTVLSEATLIRFHCFDSVTWKRDFTVSAALDPAFGGDNCIFRTFKRGNDTQGKLKVLCDEVIEIPVQSDDAEYPIAAKVQELCKSRGIAPDEFVIGRTGIGRGCWAVLDREWSPRVKFVDENGGPSDMIVSSDNPRPAKELYDRKVTELWFSIREFVESDMIRGLDRATANQLCSRTYEDKGTGGSRKDSIQKKDEMLHSPDEADALSFYIHLLREKGIMASPAAPARETDSTSLQTKLQEYDFDASEKAYTDPLLDHELSPGIFEETW